MIFVPWLLCTINAVIWSALIEEYEKMIIIKLDATVPLLDLVLTTALAFLMVYRLNRAALRWWDTRTMWGTIVADARTLTGCILEHVSVEFLDIIKSAQTLYYCIE